jgi:carbamoyl-phosphate synthase large subunit
MGAKTFDELYAWQLCADLRDSIVEICGTRALDSDLKFRDQLREAACSAPALIAEGFGRFGHREFRRYLTMARGELLEVQNDLTDLRKRRLVACEEVDRLFNLATHAARVVARLRSSVD